MDATVIVTTGLAAVAGVGGTLLGVWVGGRNATRLEDRREKRALADMSAEVQAAARLVRTELLAAFDRSEAALASDRWYPFYKLDAVAWNTHAPTLAPHLDQDDYDTVAQAYVRIQQVGLAIDYAATFTETRQKLLNRIDGLVLSEGGEELITKVHEFGSRARRALGVLAPLAEPDFLVFDLDASAIDPRVRVVAAARHRRD
jgi:hypothetical protein